MAGWTGIGKDFIEWDGNVRAKDPVINSDLVTLGYFNAHSGGLSGGSDKKIAIWNGTNALTFDADLYFDSNTLYTPELNNAGPIFTDDLQFGGAILTSDGWFLADDGTKQLILDKQDEDYWDYTHGHIVLRNDSTYNQTAIWFMSDSTTPLGKQRVGWDGSFVYGAINAYYWFAGTIDYFDGTNYYVQSMELLPNSGNTILGVVDQTDSSYIRLYPNASAPYISMNGNNGISGTCYVGSGYASAYYDSDGDGTNDTWGYVLTGVYQLDFTGGVATYLA